MGELGGDVLVGSWHKKPSSVLVPSVLVPLRWELRKVRSLPLPLLYLLYDVSLLCFCLAFGAVLLFFCLDQLKLEGLGEGESLLGDFGCLEGC